MIKFKAPKVIIAIALPLILIACSKGKISTTEEESQPSPENQPPYTVPPPASAGGADFLYGSNMGYYDGWRDEQLAEVLIGNPSKNISGAGVNSLRPALYEHFVNQWGYDIRLDAFKTYEQLGAINNTIFLNGPTEEHRDKTKYCGGQESKTFANLYEPIWSGDGKVNPNNYYATYVYNVVKTYSPYVKYWEVWNEPDFTGNWGATQTWANEDPSPCDLSNFSAPIESYVRMLRITYEIVKSVNPSGMVCVGGLGYSGFLDAILRNTDNPNGGTVSNEYPKKGGDWFDVVSYHVYPMYDLGGNKNSDAAAATISTHKNEFQNVLNKYSVQKGFIVTETNIPRKPLNNYIGGTDVQRNFLIKAAVVAQKSGINGLYIYGPAEGQSYGGASDPYKMMGFYEQITGGPYNVKATEGAVAWRVTRSLLGGRRFDKNATDAMQLPPNADGAAFYSDADKKYVYVLWAKTSGTSESASVSYNFPASTGVTAATQYNWDGSSTQVSAAVSLTGAPVFIKQ